MSVISVLSILSEFSLSEPIAFANYDHDRSALISQQEFNLMKSERITPIGSHGRF
jgi:hypothetical protein